MSAARRGGERLGTAVLLAVALAEAVRAEDAFHVQSIAVAERVLQADLVDLDGDGRGDLLSMWASGMPPDERREIQVYYQHPDGEFPARPDWSSPLPRGVGAYDLAPLDDRAGEELILLRSDRLTLLSWPGREASSRDLMVGEGATIAAVPDERGVDHLAIARAGLGPELRLLVPGLGQSTVLSPSGEVLGRLEVGGRANYYVPLRPGPMVSENEVEIYFDHPRISVGDVDGDGRGDVVASSRHELRVFLQDEQGRFPNAPSRRIALGLVSPEDHVRNSGSVRVDAEDFNGDGRLDLLIASSSGGLFDARTRVAIHLNRDGGWNLDRPDQIFPGARGLTGTVVIDLDGDGRLELIQARVPTGALEIAEVLITRAIDAQVAIYRRGASALFDPTPWYQWKLGIGFSFETFRPLGFVPTLEVDLNGDGIHDLLGSGDGKRLEVNLGRPDGGYDVRGASQTIDTGGRIRFGDLDADGLSDFVLYDPRRPGTPVRIGTNRGVLPGTRRKPSIRSPGS